MLQQPTVTPLPARRLIVHVGTHKTGTKALQVYLAANRLQLAETGVHYPLAGRHRLKEHLNTPGHHQLAFDLMNDSGGTSLAAVVSEIRLTQAATVVLSSEEFLPLADIPGALETIVGTARDLGYEPIAVIVLRAQPDFLESSYSEIAKVTVSSSLDDLVEQATTTGRFLPRNTTRTFTLTYTTVVEKLEAIFGVGNVIPRAYRPDRGLDFGHTDFLRVVANMRGGLQLNNARNPLPSANERLSLLELLENIVRTSGARIDARRFVQKRFPQFEEVNFNHPFSLMTRDDRLRFVSRFAVDNAELNARFGIDIPLVSLADAALSDADELRAHEHRALLAAILQATQDRAPHDRRAGLHLGRASCSTNQQGI